MAQHCLRWSFNVHDLKEFRPGLLEIREHKTIPITNTVALLDLINAETVVRYEANDKEPFAEMNVEHDHSRRKDIDLSYSGRSASLDLHGEIAQLVLRFEQSVSETPKFFPISVSTARSLVPFGARFATQGRSLLCQSSSVMCQPGSPRVGSKRFPQEFSGGLK
jgi:hypothetical protein